MPYLAHNGQSLYYEVSGSGPIAIIFSHGLLMDNEMFNQQIEFFQDKYLCVAWDQRCHGKTASDSIELFNYYDSANDLITILDALKIEKAILIGMSQGGYLSLRCALKHRDRVNALILIDTQAQLEDNEKISGYKVLIDSWMQDGLTQETSDFLANLILGNHSVENTLWQEKWKRWKPHNLFAAFYALTDREDISEQICELDLPTLVIHGENDKAITLERAKDMATRLNTGIAIIPKAGHAGNLTHAAQVNPIIEEFINEISFR
ncbi:alpha/beta fold hydrolase [Acinetobacter dispersus]|uniref:AB hydrolase-1 domain-containing protein n=1 Tax=Acinetobacter dispersus TaxID=70348 RepID=N9MJA8_9GAMM|nr:alpha/beta hydrolase [Acinetobacter dispersus]ENW93380.1 hypothetical protein F904_01436 [Acinetobacter dispersus]